jgi:chitinase
LVSIGGATYSEGGFATDSAAILGANLIWETFGPLQPSSSAPRPFGSSVVDGFDFDFETRVQNMATFANQLRRLMDADTEKQWLLTAAPQCPYPDIANEEMLNGTISFDAIWIQFYNNYCGLQSFVMGSATQDRFNFETWDTWARTVSKKRDVRIMLGIPAYSTAAGSGYMPASELAPIVSYCKQFSSFGGVMTWDASQAYANTDRGFLNAIKADVVANINFNLTHQDLLC